MISLDGSVIPAIIIFLTLVVVLNYTLFRPLLRVQAEREGRTSGSVAQAQSRMQHYEALFSQYQASIKNARMEGYRLQERARADALKKRGDALDQSRNKAEELVAESRESIQNQVQAAKVQLGEDAQEMARNIVTTVLHRSA